MKITIRKVLKFVKLCALVIIVLGNIHYFVSLPKINSYVFDEHVVQISQSINKFTYVLLRKLLNFLWFKAKLIIFIVLLLIALYFACRQYRTYYRTKYLVDKDEPKEIIMPTKK